MKDIPTLYQTYLSLPEKRHGMIFSGVQLIHRGPSSVAFADEKHIVKIIVANHDIVTPVEKEFMMLELLQTINNKKFVTPAPIEWGTTPHYLVMSRLGTALSHKATSREEYRRAADAMGEFSAEIWAMGGLIHTDIHMNNMTSADGGSRFGIIDIAAIKKADFFEEVFMCPLLRNEFSCPVMAKAFTKKSDIAVDFDRVEDIVSLKLPLYTQGARPSHAAQLTRIVAKNLQEWRVCVGRSPAPPQSRLG